MNEIERIKFAAAQSIGRGCLFALLAIGMTMFGLIAWPILAFKSGAILTAMMTAVLALRGETVPRQDYRRTETWLLMGQQHALPDARAQGVIVGLMQEVYRRFALYAGVLSAGLLAMMLLALAIQPPGDPWVFTYRA